MTESSHPILYSFRRCPYAMRARMALKISGLNIELREILLKNKPKCMLEYSAKGTVPVLIVGGDVGGEVIDESYDVMLWALKQNDPQNWLNGFEKSELLINECDNQFKPILDSYKYNDQNKELQLKSRNESLEFLNKLESKLKATLFLNGNNCTLADIAIFPFIRQFAYVDIKWFEASEFEFINKWMSSLIDSELFQSIMPKHPLFLESDQIIYL